MKQISILSLILIFLFLPSYADDQIKFLEWKKSFKNLALENGISETTFDIVMKNIKFLPKVIEYDRFQPEFYEDTKTYISKRANTKKVNSGLKNKELMVIIFSLLKISIISFKIAASPILELFIIRGM